MEISQHIAAIDRDGELMSAAARQAGLDAIVPSCAPWQVRDLLKHQGYVHRWAASFIGQQLAEPADDLSEAEVLAAGPPDDELLGWFNDGYQALAQTLRAADPAVQCWTFMPAPSPLAFWARRQAHETAIHRVDAQLAAGAVTPFPAEFAADGIDELIMGFLGRRQRAVTDGQRTLRVVAADAAADWLVTVAPDGSDVAHVERGPAGAGDNSAGNPDATVTGPASDLYLLLWNRSTADGGSVSVAGDADLMKSWPERMHVTWG
jgi:uncharacterized protein (TIGR03083 family)